MNITVAGIDYSMTNPSVCIYSGNCFSFEECQFLVMTDYKPKNPLPSNIRFIPHPKYTTEIERFSNIANEFYKFIGYYKPDRIGIEGYSMGSRGMVFNIGENTAVLKYRLYEGGYNFISIAPTTIKKFATGSGRADKKKMVETFHQKVSPNISQTIFNSPEKYASPVSDIVDSYYIAKYMFCK